MMMMTMALTIACSPLRHSSVNATQPPSTLWLLLLSPNTLCATLFVGAGLLRKCEVRSCMHDHVMIMSECVSVCAVAAAICRIMRFDRIGQCFSAALGSFWSKQHKISAHSDHNRTSHIARTMCVTFIATHRDLKKKHKSLCSQPAQRPVPAATVWTCLNADGAGLRDDI